jgi:two-component system response regulator ChvI
LLREEEGTYEQKTQVQGISTQNILLVEDEPDLVFTYKSMLNEEGYNVDAFTDPQQALRHFAQLAPSFYKLVLLDIRMPNLNGIQLYYRIKAIDQNIKIIFVTALDAVNELSTVLPGFSSEGDIIKKPITRADYINKVKEALCC